MKVGTKSVLFGAHCFLIHPWFVAAAWTKLYGFPKDYRLWVAFAVHDLGYWGKPNMDGPEGESHVEWGANLMHRWFDRGENFESKTLDCIDDAEEIDILFASGWVHGGYSVGSTCYVDRRTPKTDWRDLCLYHSRFYAKRDRKPFSRLCVADKLAVALEPWWLYLPRAIASGEIKEYMALADARTKAGEPKYASMNVFSDDRRQWFENVCEYLRRWVAEHRDGRDDTWTPEVAR